MVNFLFPCSVSTQRVDKQTILFYKMIFDSMERRFTI